MRRARRSRRWPDTIVVAAARSASRPPRIVPTGRDHAAVDSSNPGGITHAEPRTLLSRLTASDRCLGLEVTVFDPDLDPGGHLARELTQTIVDGFGLPEPPG